MSAQVTESPLQVVQPKEARAMQRVGNQFLPQSFGELIKYSEYVAQSDLVPKDYRGKPANVAIAVQWGMELGMSPLQAIQNIAVINGRPTMWGDLVVALVQSHPDFVDMTDVEERDTNNNVTGYRVTIKRKGRSPVTRSFTRADAEKAKLWTKDGAWQTSPARMLLIRARTFAIRDLFADVLRGIGVREEVEDSITLPETDYHVVDTRAVAPVVEMPRAKDEPKPEPTATASQPEKPTAGIAPSSAAPTGEPGLHGLSETQTRILASRADAAGMDVAGVLKQFPRIDLSNINEALRWLSEKANG